MRLRVAAREEGCNVLEGRRFRVREVCLGHRSRRHKVQLWQLPAANDRSSRLSRICGLPFAVNDDKRHGVYDRTIVSTAIRCRPHSKLERTDGGRRFEAHGAVRVLNTCLYPGFRADLADRAEAELP